MPGQISRKLPPIILSMGEKVTNGSLFGIGGNAGNGLNMGQRWQGRLFGAAAFMLPGPKKSLLILGAEALQQPKYIQPLGRTAVIPTSLAYAVCIIPHGVPLRMDLGVLQVASKVAPNMDLGARSQFGFGVSYHF